MTYEWETELADLTALTDTEAATAINQMTKQIAKTEAYISYRTFSVIDGLGPIAGQMLVDKLEAIYAIEPSSEPTEDGIKSRIIHRHIGYMREPTAISGQYPGIDVSKQAVRDFLPLLIDVGGITTDEVNALLAYGVETVSKYQHVKEGHVKMAREVM